MLSQIPAVHVYKPRPAAPRGGNRHVLAEILIFVAVSVVATGLIRLDLLIARGFWGAVLSLAFLAAAELTMLLTSLAVVRHFASARPR